MPKYFYCQGCGKRKRKNPRLKGKQWYCGSKKCQHAKKNKWERERLKKDPSYRKLRKDQKDKWRHEHPGHVYQQDYRQNHPAYTQRNRELQKTRNAEAKLRQIQGEILNIVKTDSLTSVTPIPSGLYKIYPYRISQEEKIVKTDSLIVELKAHRGIAETLV
jgi:hypothetical protein